MGGRGGSMEKLEMLLRELCISFGVSGFEEDTRNVIAEKLKPYADKIEIDPVGNLICIKEGNPKGKKIMITAHMDEIGMIVNFIDKNGFVRFRPLGGLDPSTLQSRYAVIKTKKGFVEGIIGVKPFYVKKEEERRKPVDFDDLYMDLGTNSKEETEELGVKVGDPIALWKDFKIINNKFIAGRPLDNRIGCLVLIKVFKYISEKVDDLSIYAVGSVQEELGRRGIQTAAFKLKPDIAICLDVVPELKLPDVKEHISPIKVGEGVSIGLGDRFMIFSRDIFNLLIKTAEEYNIKYQVGVPGTGGTDASRLTLAREGIPTGLIDVPVRYTHAPIEFASIEDIKNAIKLCCTFIENL